MDELVLVTVDLERENEITEVFLGALEMRIFAAERDMAG